MVKLEFLLIRNCILGGKVENCIAGQYVGFTNAILLAQKRSSGSDLNEDKVTNINNRKCPFEDEGIEEFLANNELKQPQQLIQKSHIKLIM